MTIVNDLNQLNDAGTSGDWTTSGFDSPQLNNSASTIPYYIEGATCQEWPLKKGTTDGHTYDGIASTDFEDKVFVGHYYIPAPDVANIPVTEFWMQISSAAGFTTNYGRWDALPVFAAKPGSFVAIPVFTTNAGETSGTPNYAAVLSYGFTATTGDTADGKAGAFDHFYLVSSFGGHSETWTNTFFDDLIDDVTNGADAEVAFGVLSRSGNFFDSRVNFELADGTSDTANTIITETDKTIYFNNVQTGHNLGYIFNNPSSTHELRLFLTRVVHFWNDQDAGADIFINPNNADYFQLIGCSFTSGGDVELPTHTVNRFTRGCTFGDCGEIDVGDHDFDGNTITNATSGAFYPVTGTLRAKNNVYSNCTDAIRLTGTGPVTVVLDGDQFSGNTDDIHWAGTGQLTVQNSNGANATSSRVSGGGTVVFETAVTVLVTGLTEGTSVKIIALETVGTVTIGDILVEEFANSLGQVIYNHNYEGDLDIVIRARNHGITVAAIASDGGVFTDETTNANSFATNDMNILPAVPAVNDAYYFGGAESFSRLKLDISDINGTGSTITWEYWNGSIWTALSGVVDGTSNFENSGENIVSWTVPGDWATTTVNSQGPLLYVRARLSVVGSANQTRARKCTLDTTRYLPFVQNNTIASTGVIVIAVWVPDNISKFNPLDP